MPRAGQIIPNYLHPHTQVYINDNTEFKDVVSGAADGMRFINVFTSRRGRDGVLLPFTSLSAYLEEYGDPNYKLDGQAPYMPVASLSTNVAKCWCMRIMPEDAAYSNIVLIAKVKVDKTDAANPKLVIKYESMFQPSLTNVDEFDELVDIMEKEDPDINGFVTMPIIGFHSLGRGEYGNQMRVRINQSIQLDRDNAYKNLRVEILDVVKGLTRQEVFTGTLADETFSGSNSLFIQDVVGDNDRGSKKVGMYVRQESLEKIYNMYVTEIDPTTTLSLETIDVLQGKDKEGKAIKGIEIATTGDNVVSLDAIEGLYLAGGTEGSFAVNPANPQGRDLAIEQAYVKAFTGGYDKSILSKRKCPADAILDANYPADAKAALASLFIKRYDAMGVLDAGLLNTIETAIEWGTQMQDTGDRIFVKEFQHYKMKDPFTGKVIKVTTTHFLASKLPTHYATTGSHIPFVGEEKALLTNMLKNTLLPMVDADDLEIKEELYKRRLNYYECIAENKYIRGTQTTSQNIWSDLSEEHNMRIMLEMKRIVENFASTLTYNFAEASDRQRFKEQCAVLLSGYTGKVRSFEITFEMNPWEEERSILHTYLSVIFKTIAKRNIIEIDINKRV